MPIVTKGLWLLSSDPRSVAIRLATRAGRRSLTDADYVERAIPLLGRNLSIRGLGRVGYEDPLCSNVDQNVLTLVMTLEIYPVALIDSATGFGDLQSIESFGWRPAEVAERPLVVAESDGDVSHNEQLESSAQLLQRFCLYHKVILQAPSA